MNKPATSPISSRSSIIRALLSVCSARGLRRLLLVCLWCATAVALFYGFENWRGRRAWDKYRQLLIARGEQLDLPGIIPPAVPDEQNFAATPFIQNWFARKRGVDNHWGDNFVALNSKVPSASKNKGRRHLLDLGAWQKAFAGEGEETGRLAPVNLEGEARAAAARAVLEELKEIEPIFAELREASGRPFSRYPVVYDLENPWGIRLPHLPNIRSACQRLQLKACAELAAGHTDQAFADTQLLLRLVESLKGEPFLVAFLVRVADVQTAIQPVWEGLVEHRWTEAQLEQLQNYFLKMDFKSDARKPLDCERSAALWTVDTLRKKGNLADLVGIDAETGTFAIATRDLLGKALRFMPRGWSYQEQLNYCRLFDRQFGEAWNGSARLLDPSILDSAAAQTEQELKSASPWVKLLQHKLAASLLLPGLGNIGYRAAVGQVAADQAAIACALERYYLARKCYPEILETLSPRFLKQVPSDVISGRSYNYRPQGDTGYVLYSVGWNEQDDGGAPGPNLLNKEKGDWVWEVLK